MILIERDGDTRIRVQTDNDLRDRDLIKMIDGVRYDAKRYTWTAPLTWAACRSMRGIFGQELKIGEDLAAWATEHLATVVNPALALRQAWDAPGDEDLYPFQRAGVQMLSTVKRALLLDEMGTGKTVQTIRTLKELTRRGENPFPAIIVAPNNMVLTWVKEFAHWWPELKVVAIRGSANERRKIIEAKAHHVYVINYESVRLHSRLAESHQVKLRRCVVCDPTAPKTKEYSQTRCEWCKKELNKRDWHTVVVDECHRMKNPKAKQTMAIWALRTDATQFAYGLSGTPISSTPDDLWPALHLISKEEFAVRSKYVDRYCATQWMPFGAGLKIMGLRHDTKDEFYAITDPHTRRMPKEAVLPFLPKKTYTRRYVEMAPKQRRAYDQMLKGLIATIGSDDDSVVVASNPLVQLTRLSQFASAYAETDEAGNVRLTAPSCKVDAMMEILEELGDEPLVIFSHSRQLAELAMKAMADAKISYSAIVGDQNMDEREKAKTDFQDGHVRVVICTIAAGGIGITLTRSSRALFLQRSWSMIENKQAEDRVHRIGSEIHDKIEIIDLVSEGTMEERQLDIVLPGKEGRMQEITRDAETVRRIIHGGEFLICEVCGKSDKTVMRINCGYQEDLHGTQVQETICISCENDHVADI